MDDITSSYETQPRFIRVPAEHRIALDALPARCISDAVRLKRRLLHYSGASFFFIPRQRPYEAALNLVNAGVVEVLYPPVGGDTTVTIRQPRRGVRSW
jgi:hypothetical protein